MSAKKKVDPASLSVEELKTHLKSIGHSTVGSKQILMDRLGAAQSTPKAQPQTASGKRKAVNKREPQRDEYDTEEEFHAAWHRWRETRDSNNESVKRSRQAAKEKKQQHEALYNERQKENERLERQVSTLKEQVQFLTKVLKSPDNLDTSEKGQLEKLLETSGETPQQ